MIQSDEIFKLICDLSDIPSSDFQSRIRLLRELSLRTLDHELGIIFINPSHIVQIDHRYTISLVSLQDGNVLGVSHCMCGGNTLTITAMHLSASFDGDAIGGKLARRNLIILDRLRERLWIVIQKVAQYEGTDPLIKDVRVQTTKNLETIKRRLNILS